MLDLAFLYKKEFGHFPVTWREFVSGLDYISRHNARQDLRAANVTQVANSTAESSEPWFLRMKTLAGWT